MTIARPLVLQRLQDAGLPYLELPLQDRASILLPGFGGRCLGPFFEPDGESVLWVSAAFKDRAAFQKLVAEDWNMGGDRFWIGPEIQYLTRDRFDYWGSGFIPLSMDPGEWSMEKTADGCRLSLDVCLEAFNLSRGWKDLHVEVGVRPAANPLRFLNSFATLMSDVTYAGYEQEVLLCEQPADEIRSAIWNLAQVPGGGQVWIPAAPGVEVSDYMAPIDEDHLQRVAGGLAFEIDGRSQYKTGVKAAQAFGRIGYYRRLHMDQAHLVVRMFTNHPANDYLEEPPEQIGHRGDSIHIYNDNGDYGDFGELECHGQTIGGPGGPTAAQDRLELFVYAGPPERLRRIGLALLGMEIQL